MNDRRIFGYLENGDIEISSFTEKYFEQCTPVLEYFFSNESLCVGFEIDLPESKQARSELILLCKVIAEYGVCIMARDVKLDKIVGIVFNEIQIKSTNLSDYFTFRTNNTQSENGKMLLKMIMEFIEAFDCYGYFETNCIFSIAYLSTLPEYERKTIGKMLMFYSLELARELKDGKSLELLPECLRNKVRPGAITATFSSNYSHKIGTALGFKTLHEAFYKDVTYKGKTLDERITGGHKSVTLTGKKLQ